MYQFIDQCSDLKHDPRFAKALDLFNACDWYSAHDAFEELWHESHGSIRITLQGLLQVAVAQFHFERGNLNGATILFGEALGRLKKGGDQDLGLDIQFLCESIENRLKKLQDKSSLDKSSLPTIRWKNG